MPAPHPPDGDLDWQDGQPVSRRFGDVYFSRDSGLGEARHVFLLGNDLPARWSRLADGTAFVVGETGFGTGLNFVSAWRLWREAAPPGARLHVLSVERHPLRAGEIDRALGLWPLLDRYRAALVARWTGFAPGWHRLAFDDGRILLTLLIGDARDTLPRARAAVDAWFLDGFAPARNPELWSSDVLAAVARLSRPGTTFATYTAAGEVRRSLEALGFEVRRTRGFARKREMLCGALRQPPARPWHAPWLERPPRAAERRALVIGAGLAGAAAAGSLAARGWDVTVVDRRDAIAAETSGNHQGVLYAHPSPHATALNALALAGLQYSVRLLGERLADRPDAWSPCGVLQLAFDATEAARQARVAASGLPDDLLRLVDRDEASARAGIPMGHGGLLFPASGWVHPPALCAALLERTRIRVVLSREALELRRHGTGWTACGAAGPLAEAPVVVVAAPAAIAALPATAHLPLRAIRGQLTHLPETPASRALRLVVCGEGYVAPARAGLHSLGATHRFRDAGTDVRAAEHAENLARLRALAPALHDALSGDHLDPAALGGRAGLRWSSPDYLPIVGPVADAAGFAVAYASLRRDATSRPTAAAPWLDGLYVNTAHGSRGLVTAPLAGEVLAAYLEDEPAPLPASVLDALHPSRFLLRALIRRRL